MANNPLDYLIQNPDAMRYALLQDASYKGGGQASKDEDLFALKPQPKPAVPTVRELVAEIGKNPARYEAKYPAKDFTPLEMQAYQLMQAAKTTPNAGRYLESLNPYFDSQLRFDIGAGGDAGYVKFKEPNIAVMQKLQDVKNTIPHELTHTLQLGKGKGVELERDQQVMQRAQAMPIEMQKTMMPSGNRFDDMREVWANINARAHEVNAAGGDFINSPEGRALFPTPEKQREYYTKSMPGVNSLTPSTGTFAANAPAPAPADRSKQSYAQQALRALGYAEGGSVDQSELDRMRFELERRSPVIEATPQSATQRAIGTVGGYLDKAGRFISGALEPIAKANPVRTALVDMFLADPLKNAGTALQDYTKTGREITEDQPYVRSPITGSGQTLRLDPRVLDIAGVAQPVVSGAVKLAGAGAKAAAPFARSTAEMANELYAAGQMPGMVSPNAYVVKPKGGNWLPGSVEKNVELMKGLDADLVDQLGLNPVNAASPHVTNWVDNKLVKYIKNEMGTPGDPLRKLADEGKLHVNPNDLSYIMPDEFADVMPSGTVGSTRTAAGFPAESTSKTYPGRNWEASSDMAIAPLDIGNLNKVFREPWMDKLPSDSKIYATQPEVFKQLGFDHLVDELKNATSATTTLPAQFRIDPAKLERMTVPEAAQHVAKINDWRAGEAIKAEKKGMMENLSATPRFEVPEAPQLSFVKAPGMKWVDVPDTTDAKGLKLCTTLGKQGGWCTMDESIGKPYGSGENRLTTLIDADGRPHAQAKISEVPYPPKWDEAKPYLDAARKEAEALPNGYTEADISNIAVQMVKDARPKNITELKPPGNSFGSARADTYAKRDPEYKTKVTDSVLKFLNAGEWGDVQDLHLYGILDTTKEANLAQRILDVSPNIPSTITAIDSIRKTLPRFITKDDLTNFLYSGYARGGSVKKPFTSPKHSSYNIDQMRHELSRQG